MTGPGRERGRRDPMNIRQRITIAIGGVILFSMIAFAPWCATVPVKTADGQAVASHRIDLGYAFLLTPPKVPWFWAPLPPAAPKAESTSFRHFSELYPDNTPNELADSCAELNSTRLLWQCGAVIVLSATIVLTNLRGSVKESQSDAH